MTLIFECVICGLNLIQNEPSLALHLLELHDINILTIENNTVILTASKMILAPRSPYWITKSFSPPPPQIEEATVIRKWIFRPCSVKDQFQLKSEKCDKQISNSNDNKPGLSTSTGITDDKIYKCSFCPMGISFNSAHRLRHHQQSQHNIKNRDTKCKNCNFVGLSRMQYKLHMAKCDAEESGNKYKEEIKNEKYSFFLFCSFPGCGKNFVGLQDLNEHKKSVHANIEELLPLMCEFCEVHFKNQKELNDHCKDVHGECGLKCQFCPLGFPNIRQLGKHMRLMHVKRCEVCQQHFKTEDDLNQHLEQEHNFVEVRMKIEDFGDEGECDLDPLKI